MGGTGSTRPKRLTLLLSPFCHATLVCCCDRPLHRGLHICLLLRSNSSSSSKSKTKSNLIPRFSPKKIPPCLRILASLVPEASSAMLAPAPLPVRCFVCFPRKFIQSLTLSTVFKALIHFILWYRGYCSYICVSFRCYKD